MYYMQICNDRCRETTATTLSGANFFISYLTRWKKEDRESNETPKEGAEKNEDTDALFIDKDGDLFYHVLATLLNPEYQLLDDSDAMRANYKAELTFYGIDYEEEEEEPQAECYRCHGELSQYWYCYETVCHGCSEACRGKNCNRRICDNYRCKKWSSRCQECQSSVCSHCLVQYKGYEEYSERGSGHIHPCELSSKICFSCAKKNENGHCERCQLRYEQSMNYY